MNADRPRRPRRSTLVTLFSDAWLWAVNKPAGMSSVSERWKRDLPTVIGALWDIWRKEDAAAPRPHVIHRLDKDTTGVLLFARNREAQVGVRSQFRARTVKKTYLALVRGVPEPRSGRVEIEIASDPRKPGRMRRVGRGGKACVTDYDTLEEFAALSLVRLTPLTGRTHQVRVSLAALGTPCAVDPLYGGDEAIYLSSIKRGYRGRRGAAEPPLMARLTLHAASLALSHPATAEPIAIDAPLPRDLRATLLQLRRWSRI